MTTSVVPRAHWTTSPLFPTLVIQLYLSGTLLVFFLGPWDWLLTNDGELLAYLVVYQIAMLVGGIAAHWTPRPPDAPRWAPTARTLLTTAIVASLALFWPTTRWLTSNTGDPWLALRDPGAAYYAFQELAAADLPTSWVSITRFAIAPLLYLPLPLLGLLWHRLGVTARVMGVLAVLTGVLAFVLTGRNKGIADIALSLPWVLLLARAQRPPGAERRRNWRSIIMAGTLAGVFVATYARNNAARQGAAEDAFRIGLMDGVVAKPRLPLLSRVSEPNALVAMTLAFNQTHGYLAMAMALRKEFRPCWGVGHTYIVQRTSERLLKVELCKGSFVRRLESEHGYQSTQFWHTTYTWFANDVSFLGVPIVLGLLAYALGLAWRDATETGNPFGAALALLLVTMHYYYPMNNIILGQPEGLMTFWVLLLLWTTTRGSLIRRMIEVARPA